jgi:hypothetical protein
MLRTRQIAGFVLISKLVRHINALKGKNCE